MLDDLLSALFGDLALDSMRGKWIARIVFGLAVLAVAGVVLILII